MPAFPPIHRPPFELCHPTVAATRPRPAGSEPALSSRELLGGAREVLIRHGDTTYRLRHTRNDKLILTK